MSEFLIWTEHLLRKHMRTALIWSVVFVLYVVAMVSIFPTFSENLTQELTEMYPKAFIEAFNIGDMSSATGFLGAEIYSYAPLVLAFFPIMALAGAIAGEEERHGLDMILSNPVSRRTIVVSNWLVIALWLLVILMLSGLASWLVAVLLDVPLPVRAALRAPLNIFPLAMLFGSFALLLSTRMRSKGSVVGIAFAVMFIAYLIDIIGKLAPEYASLRDISPFKYHGMAIIDGIDWGNWLVLFGASVVMMLIAIPSFQRRDVYT